MQRPQQICLFYQQNDDGTIYTRVIELQDQAHKSPHNKRGYCMTTLHKSGFGLHGMNGWYGTIVPPAQ